MKILNCKILIRSIEETLNYTYLQRTEIMDSPDDPRKVSELISIIVTLESELKFIRDEISVTKKKPWWKSHK